MRSDRLRFPPPSSTFGRSETGVLLGNGEGWGCLLVAGGDRSTASCSQGGGAVGNTVLALQTSACLLLKRSGKADGESQWTQRGRCHCAKSKCWETEVTLLLKTLAQ